MFEDILSRIATFPPFWIYITLFFFAFIENVFPPSPSDFVTVVGGTLIGTGDINFLLALSFATLGSILGFSLMFYIGATVDKKLIHSGKFRFIPVESLNKVETWFRKYGYVIVVVNRFMPGTRAVISFFAGISNLDPKRTIALCLISALFWNAILLYLGFIFGDNVESVDKYLTTYSNIVIVVTIVIILFFIVRYFFRKRKSAV
ncbi:MAG: DedA family protein [Ignavibacteriota bacterium]|nr:MAG: DedA family protein [Chlorobiota bacterium]MBE7476824.1 DedA family protein [Ignavibacteriales bacterium]MBL1121924.1 DedA family protein [Ignavibacteriota bacterium]MCE7855583.1 DedA family protein [Ignavibacteria bacterium CHB3]MCZ7613915.1 DedA family protein [Ignavibacteriaceae bacterium]MEB2295998.1 DedA family protein [Ignavibacteria bacterium]